MDLEHGLARLGFGNIHPDHVSNAWCCQTPEPWLIENDCAYAMTHEVFYITDFGRVPDALPSEARAYLCLWLPSWLHMYSSIPNWDIFSELVMVSACLPEFQHSGNPFSQLRLAVSQHGFLPAPEGAGVTLKRSTDTTARSEFLTQYHTNLVGLMAAKMFVDAALRNDSRTAKN